MGKNRLSRSDRAHLVAQYESGDPGVLAQYTRNRHGHIIPRNRAPRSDGGARNTSTTRRRFDISRGDSNFVLTYDPHSENPFSLLNSQGGAAVPGASGYLRNPSNINAYLNRAGLDPINFNYYVQEFGRGSVPPVGTSTAGVTAGASSMNSTRHSQSNIVAPQATQAGLEPAVVATVAGSRLTPQTSRLNTMSAEPSYEDSNEPIVTPRVFGYDMVDFVGRPLDLNRGSSSESGASFGERSQLLLNQPHAVPRPGGVGLPPYLLSQRDPDAPIFMPTMNEIPDEIVNRLHAQSSYMSDMDYRRRMARLSRQISPDRAAGSSSRAPSSRRAPRERR